MQYRGPQAADYRNVRALNAAFLVLLKNGTRAQRLLRHLPDTLQKRCAGLTGLQRERLADTPFLLFSFNEHDGAFWERLFAGRHNWHLFDSAPAADDELFKILHAALGFTWQLARDNTYAARVICGASLHWCERLADKPILDVVSVASHAELLALRSPRDEMLWRKLLYPGTAGNASIREAAHTSALQRLLTEGHADWPGRHARAARRMRQPSMQVADDD